MPGSCSEGIGHFYFGALFGGQIPGLTQFADSMMLPASRRTGGFGREAERLAREQNNSASRAMTAKGMAHVQAAAVYPVSTDAIYRSGQHYQRHARRGDDDCCEQCDVGFFL